MVRLVEALATLFDLVAYAGVFVAVALFLFAKLSKGAVLVPIGLGIVELSRQFRLHGPSFSVEPSNGTLRLTEDSSWAVFLVQVLGMPTGFVIAMLGLLWISWRLYKDGRSRKAT